MKSVWQAALATLGLLVSTSSVLAAGDCSHPYKKGFPYQLPLGSDKASVLFQSNVRFEYDCSSFLAQTDANAHLSFFELGLDIVSAQALLKTPADGQAEASARLIVMGNEVGQESIDLSDLVDINLHPPVDLDIAKQISVQVGPVSVPVKYGIEGQAALAVKGGVEGLGANVRLAPSVDSRAYVQAALDVGYAKAIANGDMIVLRDNLDNKVRVAFDDADKLYLRFDVESRNKLKALDGNVRLEAQAKLGKFEPKYNKQLFQWKGVNRDDLVLQYSDRVGLQ